MSRLKI